MNAGAAFNGTTAAGRSATVTAGDEGATAVTAMPSIEEQRDEVAREVRQRERLYPDWIAKGRYKPETAQKKLRDIRAALATLTLIAKHADGLRLLIKVLQRVERYGPARDDKYPIDDSEAELLLQQPAVRAVVAAFPGCELAEIRAIERPHDAEIETDAEDAGHGSADL